MLAVRNRNKILRWALFKRRPWLKARRRTEEVGARMRPCPGWKYVTSNSIGPAGRGATPTVADFERDFFAPDTNLLQRLRVVSARHV